MNNSNSAQVLQRLAPRFFFMRDPIGVANSSGGIVTNNFGWQDLGTLEERTSKVNIEGEQIMDDWSGISQPVTEVQNAFDMTYELTTPNTNLKLQEIYLRSTPAAAPSPALPGGTFTSVPITLYPGQPAKIVDANGIGVYGVTSITAFTVSSTPMVLGTDYAYTPQDLAAGFVRILSGSSVVTAGGTAGTISFTATALTGNVQLKPGSGPCCIQGIGEVHFNSCGSLAMGDIGYFSITIPELTLDPKKLARFKPTVRRLYDPTGVTLSRFVAYKGYPTM